MERTTNYSDETVARARKLLESNTEMLHVFPPSWRRCAHCNVSQLNVEYDEECPALLRCALNMTLAETGFVHTLRTRRRPADTESANFHNDALECAREAEQRSHQRDYHAMTPRGR